jgi:hypothetical protein
MSHTPISDLQIRENFLAEQREESLRQFKRKRPELELPIKRHHVWGGLSYELYKKQAVPLRDHEALDIITNQNLTRDTTVLWYAQGKSVKTALRMGQLNPQALTSKAIKELGKYNKKCAERKVKSRIVSVLDSEKSILLEQAQDRIEELQGLERYLGQRIYPDTAVFMTEAMIADLRNYIAKQVLSESDQQLKADNELHARHYRKWDWKRKFHAARIDCLVTNNKANIKAAEELIQVLEHNKTKAEWLQTTGNKEILSFLKGRIISVARETQGLNQVLTHQHGSWAYLRGDLNSAVEDAVKVVRDHIQDLHNPVTQDHQLVYDADQKVIVDSDFHTNGSSEQLEELMLAVSEISGNNQPLVDLKGGIQPTSATKWRHFRSFYDASNPYELSIFKNRQHLKGVLRNILLSPLNLIETAFRGNDATFITKLRYTPPENEAVVGKTDYYALNYRIKKQTSISTKIGLELYKSFNYLLVEGLWRGLYDGWKQIKRLPEDLVTDFQVQDEKIDVILADLNEELKQLHHYDSELLGCDLVLMKVSEEEVIEDRIARFRAEAAQEVLTPLLIKKGNQLHIYGFKNGVWQLTTLNAEEAKVFGSLHLEKETKLIKKGDYFLTPSVNSLIRKAHDSTGLPKTPRLEEEKSEEAEENLSYAQPAIPLTPYQSHGVLNGGVTGFNEFVDLFGHNMFAKHPFTATLSTGGAAVSFLAFFATPLAIKLLGKGYVKFLQDQGYIWTKDLFSASMAGSFTNFKLIGAVVEGIEHGPDSWLSRGISHILNDPAKTITYTTLAWAIGYSLVYLINIPGLSEELKAHIGDPPQLSEIFGGAKIGIIAYHLFSNPHEASETARKNYIDECLQNYIASEASRGREVTEEKRKLVKSCLERLVSIDAIEKLRAQVGQAQALPQSPQEKEFFLMLRLSMNKEKLSRLKPLTKARLQCAIQKMTTFPEDARALEKYWDPEKSAPKSTLRSFLGRTIGYAPSLLRCVLSPAAGIYVYYQTGSFSKAVVSVLRPWRELAEMILDDLTSTAYAVSRFTNKIFETLFNRIPRTLGDIVINGVLGRAASFFGFHGFALAGYRQSARWDLAQEKLYANSTGRVLTYLASKNTTPNPEISMKHTLNERLRATLDRPALSKVDAPVLLAKKPIQVAQQEERQTVVEPACLTARI